MTQLLDSICPICQKDTLVDSVRALEIHVNQCLDDLSHGDNKVKSNFRPGSDELDSSNSNPSHESYAEKDSTGLGSSSLSSASSEPSRKRIRTNAFNLSDKKEERPEARQCPFYKWIPNSSWTVDAFKYGSIPNCSAYFLSHFHSDHYDGLSKKFQYGPIYCSEITARLVIQQLRVDPAFVKGLPMNERIEIQDGFVTLIDANHCPGAVLFLFEIPLRTIPNGDISWKHFLHTGDFRAHPCMVQHPSLSSFNRKTEATSQGQVFDAIFLDTTYCHTSHVFPNQSDVIQLVCDLVEDICLKKQTIQVAISGNPLGKYFQPIHKQESVIDETRQTASNITMSSAWSMFSLPKKQKKPYLVLVGSYSIGKERIFFALAERLKSKVYVSAHRKRMLTCCFEPDYLRNILSNDPHQAQIHVVPMGDLDEKKLADKWLDYKVSFERLVAVRPTGWTFTQVKGSKPKTTCNTTTSHSPVDIHLNQLQVFGKDESSFTNAPRPPPFSRSQLSPKVISKDITLLPVPYSEHSSVLELEGFIRSFNVKQVIPTVNVGNPQSRDRMMGLIRQWMPKA